MFCIVLCAVWSVHAAFDPIFCVTFAREKLSFTKIWLKNVDGDAERSDARTSPAEPKAHVHSFDLQFFREIKF